MENEVAENEDSLSKKQQWVLKAMQMDPRLENQIFEYAQFSHGKLDGLKRIIIRGINDEDPKAPPVRVQEKA
jgi:hypothetical protein